MHQLVIKRFQHCLMHGVTMKFIKGFGVLFLIIYCSGFAFVTALCIKTSRSVDNVVEISAFVQVSVAVKHARTYPPTHTHVNTVIWCDMTWRRPATADDILNLYHHENITFYAGINYCCHTVTAAVMAAGGGRVVYSLLQIR